MKVHNGRGLAYGFTVAAWVAVLMAALLVSPGVTAAREDAVLPIDIAPQPLDAALLAVGRRFGIAVIAPETLTSGKTAPAVSGAKTAAAAIDSLLAGSGLVAGRAENGAFVIMRGTAAAPAGMAEEIVVTGSREYLYRKPRTDVLGFDLPISEIPTSISVITSDYIFDTASYDLEDTVAYVPGISNNGGTGGFAGENLNIRGFRSGTRFVNGLRQFGFFPPVSVENIGRVEFLKGPAGSEFALADAGGSFNYVTKKPSEEFGAEVFAGIGDFGFRRIGGDITGALDSQGRINARLIGAYSERAEWREGRPDRTERYTIAPSVQFDYSDAGSLLFEYQYTFSDEPRDQGIFYLEGAGFEDTDNFAPRAFSIHNGNSAFETNSTHRFDLSWDQDLGEVFGIEFRGQIFDYRIESLYFDLADIDSVYQADGITWDGVTTEVGILDLQDEDVDETIYNAQFILRAGFDTGGFSHLIRFGGQSYKSDLSVDAGTDGGTQRRALNTIDIFRNNNAQAVVFSPERDPFDTAFIDDTINSLFLSYFLEWNDRARLIANMRYDSFDQVIDVFLGTGELFVTTLPQQDEISVRVSVGYDVTDTVSLFAGFSDSISPQFGFLSGGGRVPPVKNTSYEVGAKISLFNKALLWSNSLFQITQDNIAAPDPADLNFFIPFGEARIRGFESEVVGSVGETLDVSGGIILLDSENTRTENPAFQGNEFASVANFEASMLASYRLSDFGLPNASVRAGIVHVGEREGNNLNNYRLPGYTRLDLGAAYVLNGRTSFDLFIENVTDAFYIEASSGLNIPSSGIQPGDRRLVQFNVRHRF